MDQYQEQLSHLKEMRKLMESSSRFLSLSGLSGILCGIYALIASVIAYFLIHAIPDRATVVDMTSAQIYLDTVQQTEFILELTAGLTLIVSICTALILSAMKAKNQGERLWNPASKNLFIHFFVPLTIGGLFGIITLYNGAILMIPAITLIFYGVALISAAKFTFGEIFYLGILEAVLGLICLVFPELSLFLWAIGFGVLHILYGSILYNKYERK